MPTVGDALQLVLALIFEDEAAACGEVLDGGRDEYVPWACQRADPRSDMHRQATNAIFDELDLARMAAGADLDAERADRGADRLRASYGARRTVEGGEEAIARRIDVVTAESRSRPGRARRAPRAAPSTARRRVPRRAWWNRRCP